MKIISLSFQNLNSLREKVELDFAEGPLAEAGIFAIVGPTGSGKTTILDALSLALYNSTARDQGREIVSRGEREAWAEVEFKVKGLRYRSRWDVRIPKSRKTVAQTAMRSRRAPTMTLSKVGGVDDGKIIADFVKKGHEGNVPERVAEITGLDFDRFRQSMLLAQGEFDAFLVAKTAERSALLEQITGTSIYSDISRLVYEEFTRYNQQYNARVAALERSSTLDPEQLPIQEASLIEHVNSSTQLAPKLLTLRKAEQAYQQQLALTKSREQLQEEQTAYEQHASARAADADAKELHQKAAPLLPVLQALLHITARHSTTATQLKAVEDLLNHQQIQLPQLQEEAASAKTHNDTAQQREQQANITVQDIKRLEREKVEVSQQQTTAQDQLAAYTKKREGRLKDQAAGAALQTQLNNRLADIDQALEVTSPYSNAHEALPAITTAHTTWINLQREHAATATALAESQVAFTQAQEAVLAFAKTLPTPSASLAQRQAHAAPAALDKVLAEQQKTASTALAWLGSFGASLKPYLGDVAQLSTKREQHAKALQLEESLTKQHLLAEETSTSAATLLDLATAALTQSRQALEAIQLTQSLRTRYLPDLAEDAECPLCGSTHHPAAAHISEHVDVEPHQQQYETAVAKEQAAALAKMDADKQLNTLVVERARAIATRQGLDPNELAQEVETTRQALANDWASRDRPTVTQFDEALRNRLNEEYTTLKNKSRELEAAIVENNKYEASLTAFSEERTTLKIKLAERLEQRDKLQATETTLQQQRSTAAEVLEQVVSAHKLPTDQLLTAEYVNQLRDAIDQRKQNISTRDSITNALEVELRDNRRRTAELAELSLTINSLRETIDTLDERIAAGSSIMSSLLGAHSTGDALLAAATSAFAKTKEALQTSEYKLSTTRELIASLNGQQSNLVSGLSALAAEQAAAQVAQTDALGAAGFGAAEEVDAAVLSPELLKQLEERQTAGTRTRTQLATREAELYKWIEENDALLLDAESRELVQQQLTATELEERERQQEIGRLRAVIAALKRQQQEFAAEQAALDKLKEELLDWSTLNTLVGSRDGNKFRKFAQRITLQQLLTHSNTYLEEFYPRFSVSTDSDPDADSLEVYVRDAYEADQIRDICTVSGGERFLVSLALALGFSRMASGNLSIDTLFIDEGFGTLDSETLDKAINALERLKQSGKTIGIISHVASLRERVSAQVQLSRISGGGSTVTVVG